ncbi:MULTISPECIES: SMI1/KNR4 family protein [unclassified Listeria]|uniref:SMI1/KNR4 family protein n=1 Tax=unclassified Listeria TaxID=2642072 RepID=UPI000B58FAF5|nr:MULTISPECIES: SMI1/KNR4 family protein [unclassified Listeria]
MYKFMKNNPENDFYNVSKNEIVEVENQLGFTFPSDLIQFYTELGYGFVFEGDQNNDNRLMDPVSVKDFRLRKDYFAWLPDIEVYSLFEENKLIFFQINESAFLSIGFKGEAMNKIFYDDTCIAQNLQDFFKKMEVNNEYYLELV